MNPKPIEQAKDAILRSSLQALRRAAQRARELAQQTGTAIVVSRQGVIEHIPPQPAQVVTAQESPALYGKQPR